MILKVSLGVLALYLVIGMAFALPFAFVGAGRIDPDARKGTLGFRLLLLPGATLLWPLLALRWLRAGPDGAMPMECTPHKRLLAQANSTPECEG